MQNEINNKEIYRQLCLEQTNIPLFLQAWWMDAVCNDDWDVLLAKNNDKIEGVLVYSLIQKAGFKLIINPQLTQNSGLWLNYPQKMSAMQKLDFEKRVCNILIDGIEKMDLAYYDQCFHYSFGNWLPFYWRNFTQTTRYTYQIKDISDTDQCFKNFSYAKRKQIKKAEKALSIDFSLSPLEFYIHLKENLAKKKQDVFYSEQKFLNLYAKATERKQAFIISASDSEDKIHAALFIVWDNMSAYNLISSIDPDCKSSGASTLVVWEAIKYLSGKTQIFDFEGSMDENIENSFKQFGTEQVPYFRIIKEKSQIFKALLALRKWQ